MSHIRLQNNEYDYRSMRKADSHLSFSIGLSLTDTLDDLINEGRIEPQLAMKILSTFDRVITEVLADKVQVKLSFKVRLVSSRR